MNTCESRMSAPVMTATVWWLEGVKVGEHEPWILMWYVASFDFESLDSNNTNISLTKRMHNQFPNNCSALRFDCTNFTYSL
jgi:hypothetical protein